MDHLYRESYANVHRGVYSIAEEATAAYEGARARLARFLGAGAPGRDRLHPQRHRGDQPRRLHLGPGEPANRRRRSCSPSSSTTPTSSRGTSSPPSGASNCAGCPSTSEYRLDTTGLDRLLDGAKLFAFSAASNVLGTINDVRALADAAHAHGALALVDAAQFAPHRRVDLAALGRRLRGRHRPQDARADRDRRAVGPPGAARGDAALPRRRRDDPRRPPGRVHAERGPVEVRGGHDADRRGRRARTRRSTTSTASAWTRSKRTRSRSPATRSRALEERFGDRLSIYGPHAAGRPRRRRSRSSSTGSTRTTSPRSSTSTACACAPGITAPSRSCACWASRRRPAPRSTCTTTRPTSTPWSRRWPAAERFFAS